MLLIDKRPVRAEAQMNKSKLIVFSWWVVAFAMVRTGQRILPAWAVNGAVVDLEVDPCLDEGPHVGAVEGV